MPRGNSVMLFERVRHDVGKIKEWGSEGGMDWNWDAWVVELEGGNCCRARGDGDEDTR